MRTLGKRVWGNSPRVRIPPLPPENFRNYIESTGCSAVGSALRSGRRGRGFESRQPDQKKRPHKRSFFLYTVGYMAERSFGRRESNLSEHAPARNAAGLAGERDRRGNDPTERRLADARERTSERTTEDAAENAEAEASDNEIWDGWTKKLLGIGVISPDGTIKDTDTTKFRLTSEQLNYIAARQGEAWKDQQAEEAKRKREDMRAKFGRIATQKAREMYNRATV